MRDAGEDEEGDEEAVDRVEGTREVVRPERELTRKGWSGSEEAEMVEEMEENKKKRAKVTTSLTSVDSLAREISRSVCHRGGAKSSPVQSIRWKTNK
jgi:hypothetical protein